MTSERKMFLKELVKVTVAKMECKADADWSIAIEGEEDEDDLQFAEMRKVCMLSKCAVSQLLTFPPVSQNLRVISDAIAFIDIQLYSDVTKLIVIGTLDLFEVGGASAASLTWQRLELAMTLLYGFGKAFVTART